MTPLLEAARAGYELALAYNPIFAGAFAAVAAALCARRERPGRTAVGIALLVAGWLVGDGMRVIASARDIADQTGALLPALSVQANWIAVAVWAVAGAGLGYALPAWAGAFVGRRVTFGTGWLAAAAVSVTVSGLVAASVSGAL